MFLADMTVNEVAALFTAVGTVLGGGIGWLGSWAVRYKRGQDDYLFAHFREEIVTIKADVALLKLAADEARKCELAAVEREAKCREEMSAIRAELKIRREGDEP